MHDLNDARNRRILVVDDNSAIHADFRSILAANANNRAMHESYAAFFGEELDSQYNLAFEIDSAFQGREALAKVSQSRKEERPYAMAFVDVRMPPGWDGIETIGHLWKVDPHLLVVICTAYSDYSWSEMAQQLSCMNRWQILKKPFDNIEVRQLAASLTEKWDLARQARLKMDDLEQLVAERTRKLEITQQQLFESQKMEAIGQLAGGIAHEFNNLLQVIHGYTSFAMEDLPPKEQRYQELQQVIHASERASILTSHLLSFGRRQAIQPTDIQPNKVVTDLVKMIKPLIGEHVEIETRLGEDTGDVHADPTMIQQVLMNLCLNARDAMSAGGQLTIKTENVVLSEAYCNDHADFEPGQYVLLSLVDTGCGMSPEVQRRIFEPFFTTKKTGKGTGLGLAMVFGTVQQHGGFTHVYSEAGLGTTFKIYLPAINSTKRREVIEALPTTRGGTETVLVAEDEPMVRDLAVRLLEGAGYTVLAAEDGEEAIRVFEGNAKTIDLAVLDVVLPKMHDGMLLQVIRSLNPEIKVMYCSGYDTNTIGRGIVKNPDMRLLKKPFDPNVFLRTVREVLDEKETCMLPINLKP